MNDPISAGVAKVLVQATDSTSAEAAKTAGALTLRLLGPSVDVLGRYLADLVESRHAQRVIGRAAQKASENHRRGAANPRLLASVLQNAQFAKDGLVAEYLSGILASSVSEGGADDSGLPWNSMIASMSSLQLRLHYITYANARTEAIRPGIDGAARPIGAHALLHGAGLGSGAATIVLPSQTLSTEAERDDEEFESRVLEALDGLVSMGLIGDWLGSPNREVFVQLSFDGIALYMKVLGGGHLWSDFTMEGLPELVPEGYEIFHPSERVGLKLQAWDEIVDGATGRNRFALLEARNKGGYIKPPS
jgi:hypothetical protein